MIWNFAPSLKDRLSKSFFWDATSFTAVFSAICLLAVVSCVASYIKTRAIWKTIPKVVFPMSPVSLLSGLFPYSQKWNPGIQFNWDGRNKTYSTVGSETVVVVGFLKGTPTLYTSSPEVLRQILANKAPYSKTDTAKETVGFMGPNVLASDGDLWKTHRKIVAPAFSYEGYKRVWAETLRTYREMSAAEGWDEKTTVALPSMHLNTRKLALFIIASCGFNLPLAWTDGEIDEDGQMTFQAIMATVASSILVRWLTPKWMYYLPNKFLHRVDASYDRLDSFLRSQVGIRKKEIREELESGAEPLEAKRELFSRLVAASVNEGKLGLSDQEIIGNTFVLLFAGHETTAHTLATTLIMLGLYEEEQARVYKHIVNVLGDRVPTFEDCEALESVVLSAVYETLRLYPAAFMTARTADQDASLSLPKMDGSGTTELHVPKGTVIALDFIGAGYNRRCYPDANFFNPSRWDGRHDTSLSFSDGPRTCVGRKFATTEMVCFLTLMLLDWEIQVSREEDETREQWRERVMQPKLVVTMELPPVPLKLVRRRR